MEKTHKIILSVLAVFLVGIITACVIVSQTNSESKDNSSFSAPAFDTNAVILNSDDIPTSAQYKSLTIKENFKVYMSSVVNIKDNVADIYFTSDNENIAWLKIEILSADCKTSYGESGLLKKGESLKQIKLTEAPQGNELVVKILSYEPGSYYSLGTATIKVEIAK